VKLLIDTNVLLRLRDPRSPHHSDCLQALNHLRGFPKTAYTCAQVLVEYWVVATRPREVNGLGLSTDAVDRYLSDTETVFPCLAEPSDIAARWRKLVVEHGVQGRPAYDARLVALMQAHALTHLVTLNTEDFARYTGITTVTPSEAVILTTPQE
jgi:predicted nucleic acid-binding protein